MKPYIVTCFSFLTLFIIFVFLLNGNYQNGDLIVSYKTGLFIFGGLLLVVLLVTARIHEHSANGYDYIIRDIKPSLINICLWTTYWLCWTVFNLVFLFAEKDLGPNILFVTLITNLPGLVIFWFTWSARKEELSAIDPALLKEDNIFKEYEGELRSGSFRYYSGFYGLITIPVFVIGFLIHFIFFFS